MLFTFQFKLYSLCCLLIAYGLCVCTFQHPTSVVNMIVLGSYLLKRSYVSKMILY